MNKNETVNPPHRKPPTAGFETIAPVTAEICVQRPETSQNGVVRHPPTPGS